MEAEAAEVVPRGGPAAAFDDHEIPLFTASALFLSVVGCIGGSVQSRPGNAICQSPSTPSSLILSTIPRASTSCPSVRESRIILLSLSCAAVSPQPPVHFAPGPIIPLHADLPTQAPPLLVQMQTDPSPFRTYHPKATLNPMAIGRRPAHLLDMLLPPREIALRVPRPSVRRESVAVLLCCL